MLDEGQKQFQSWLSHLGIRVDEELMQQFERYYGLLLEWNQHINLTAITERQAVYVKHFYDSLTCLTLPFFDPKGKTLDVGAGAGFPGVPIRLICKDLPLYVLDSLNKRIGFLTELGKQLGLTQFFPVHGRAEDFGQKKEWREQFDQVTARAVAKMNVLSEYCLPFVRVGGYFFALKGPEAEEEVREAGRAISLLGGKVRGLQKFQLPEGAGSRMIVIVEKCAPTPPKYPRKAGLPAKKPL